MIVLKAFADRPQDWVDVRGIFIRQGDRLNFEEVRSRLRPLVELKEEPGIMAKLEGVLKSLG